MAQLWILARRLAAKLDRVRDCYHAELLTAVSDGVTAAEIGHEILTLEGKPPTEANATRAEWNVRRALRVARKRRGIGDPANAVAVHDGKREADGMRRSPVLVREYWFSTPPSSGLGGAEIDIDDIDDLDERLSDLRERDEREARDDRDDEHERDAHERDAHTREDR